MTTKTFIAFIIALIFAACNNSRKQVKPEQETPKALEEKNASSEILSKRGNNDLVESLYNELTEKDANLKNLEDQIRALNDSRADSTKSFAKFNNKNENYYRAATRYIDQLGDTVLKGKMKTLISNSLANYKASIARQDALLKEIESRNTTLTDLHIILKITKTLPLIEKYQTDNSPSIKPLEGFIQRQNQAVRLADSLSKK